MRNSLAAPLVFFLAAVLSLNLFAVSIESIFSSEDILKADTKGRIVSKKVYKESNITDLKLSNGMRVCLKRTDSPSEEINVRLMAVGGVASLPPHQKASGKLAPYIAIESGIGELTGDQLSALLYDHLIEFSAEIAAFSRTIDGSCDESGLPILLKLAGLFFSQPNYTLEAYFKVVKEYKEWLLNIESEHTYNLEEAFLSFNTQQYEPFQTLSLKDLDNVEYQTSREFFLRSFSDPSEFFCVIVGSFKPEDIERWVALYLGGIPSLKSKNDWMYSKLPEFPKGKIGNVVHPRRPASLTRLTYPLALKINENNLVELQYICQIIENRLKEALKKEHNAECVIDAAYYFPMEPLLDKTWITIDYQSAPTLVDKYASTINQELNQIRTAGVNPQDLKRAKEMLEQSDNLSTQENDFWMAALSNYYARGWDLENIHKHFQNNEPPSLDHLQKLISANLQLDNYTIIKIGSN